MVGKYRDWAIFSTALCATFTCLNALRAEETKAPKDVAPAPAAASAPAADAAAPANSGLQREYARLAQLLNSDDVFGKQEAASAFLRVRPSDVPNADTRKLIARGYRSLATDGNGLHQDEAIRGLVIWGGKYSVPILIELLDKDKLRISPEVFTALGDLKDPRGAEAVARHLGNFFNNDAAVASLRRMGPAAEDTLIKIAPSNDPKVSLAAVQLLGEVGGEKSNGILLKASAARNQDIKMAAREAMKQIRLRQKGGAPADAGKAADPDSPFAEGSGPAVDITAKNTRDFAARTARATPAAAVGAAAGDLAAGAMPEEPPADLNEGDWSKVNPLLPGDPAGKGVPADPSKNALDSAWKPQPVRLSKTAGHSERPESIDVSGGSSPIAMVLHSDPFSKSLSRLEYIDLKQRRSLGSSNIVGGKQSVYLSPSGQRMLTFSQQPGIDSTARLTVYDVKGGKPTEQLAWSPYATSKDHWAGEIKWLEWVDEEQLVTLNGKGMLVLWRLDDKTPHAMYQLDVDSYSMPAVSPGGAHLALVTNRGVEIFRASDGELLARMPGGPTTSGALAFNKNGDQLACVARGNFCVWNATTGELIRDFYCNVANGSWFLWLNDHYLFVGGKDVVDIDRRLIAWRYESSELAARYYGGWLWMVMTSGDILGIVPTQPLQEEVLSAAKELKADDILALKPGAKIAIDVQVGGEEQAKAEAALRKAIENNGMTVVADSPIRVRSQIVTGKSETKEYGRHAFSEATEQVTTTERRYELELTIDGQSAWKSSSTIQSAGGPGIILKKEGETAQQVVDRQNAQWAANFGFGASLPRYLVQPKYMGPLGTSKISFGGGQ